MISCKYECLGEVVPDPFLLKCIGLDDCNASLSFQTINLVLIVTVYHIYLFLPQSPQKFRGFV